MKWDLQLYVLHISQSIRKGENTMIKGNGRWSLRDEERAKFQFFFCEGCSFYPCERVNEFSGFAENHPEDITIKDRRTDPILKAELYKIENVSKNTVTCNGRIIGKVNTILLEEYKKDENVNQTMIIPDSVVTVEEYVREKKSSIAEARYYSDKNSFSYDIDEMKNGCIMGPCNVAQIECGTQTVTDGIGDHYKVEIEYDYNIKNDSDGKWEPLQSVIISAQTGQGKNYFIEKKVIPYVDDLNYKNNTKQKVLIISNRLALKYQIKNRLNGMENSDEDDEGEIYSYKETADIMTYQSILGKKEYLKRIQRSARSKYLFVICDEAHFFTSDAMFNPYTDKILQTIASVFNKAIRVYMTATPYECLAPIIQYEKHMPVFYHFKRNYNYLNICTYQAIEELYEIIIKSVARKEKWLIFIDDKQRCERIKESLERMEEKMCSSMQNANFMMDKIYAVNAESKKDRKYLSMIQKERLGEDIYVLITTSVLDNGVNLRDVDHIVVSDMAQVKCLQMVGRARVNDQYDHKTLYIKRFDIKYVRDRIYDLKEQKKAYHAFDLAYGDVNGFYYHRQQDEYNFFSKYYEGEERDWKNAKHWFRRASKSSNQLQFNPIAKVLAEKYLARYEFIYREMEEEREETSIVNQETRTLLGQKYLEYQISWFEKSYCVENDSTLCKHGKAEKAFLDFLSSYADEEKQISKEMQVQFKEEFTELHDAVFPRADKNKSRVYGINVMNKIMKKNNLCYKLENQSSYWKVIRFVWNAENIQ